MPTTKAERQERRTLTAEWVRLDNERQRLEAEIAKLREHLTNLADSWLHRHAQTDDNRNLLYCRDELIRALKR